MHLVHQCHNYSGALQNLGNSKGFLKTIPGPLKQVLSCLTCLSMQNALTWYSCSMAYKLAKEDIFKNNKTDKNQFQYLSFMLTINITIIKQPIPPVRSMKWMNLCAIMFWRLYLFIWSIHHQFNNIKVQTINKSAFQKKTLAYYVHNMYLDCETG